MFFCEGVKVLFRVGLVILKHSFAKSKTIKDCPTMYESMEVLRHLEPAITDENLLVSRVKSNYQTRCISNRLKPLYLTF